jgi:hypothetical protein
LNTIVPLTGTANTKGGERYTLTMVASHPNYNITVHDGYMWVMPKPAELYVDALGQNNNNTSLAAVVTPEQLKQGHDELEGVQAELLVDVKSDTEQAALNAIRAAQFELNADLDLQTLSDEELQGILKELQDIRNTPSAEAVKRLRKLPRVPRRPVSLPQLLSDSSSSATVK